MALVPIRKHTPGKRNDLSEGERNRLARQKEKAEYFQRNDPMRREQRRGR